MQVRLAPMRPLTKGPGQHFFGYFDKSPWSPSGDGDVVLAHRTTVSARVPMPGEEIEIGVVNGRDGTGFEVVAYSRAWNLQQGAMAQWLPSSDATIIYNDIESQKPCAVRVDLSSGRTRIYERPVAAIAPDGTRALSINFARLTAVKPEYGYAGLADPFGKDPMPEDDGIWQLDLNSGQAKLILSIAKIAVFESEGSASGVVHYVNHPLFSRTGDRFCFLHRSINSAGTEHTRLMSCQADGTDLRVLISGMASHFGWRNATELLAWAGERALMRSATVGIGRRLPVGIILKKIYRALGKPAAFKSAVMKDRYIVFNHEDGTSRSVARGVLKTDGHCSFSSDGDWFVTDTYPDGNGMATLYLCHWRSEQVYAVQNFHSALDGAIRCDLHPRWHPSKPLICVDSAHSGERQMYEIDVSDVTAS